MSALYTYQARTAAGTDLVIQVHEDGTIVPLVGGRPMGQVVRDRKGRPITWTLQGREIDLVKVTLEGDWSSPYSTALESLARFGHGSGTTYLGGYRDWGDLRDAAQVLLGEEVLPLELFERAAAVNGYRSNPRGFLEPWGTGIQESGSDKLPDSWPSWVDQLAIEATYEWWLEGYMTLPPGADSFDRTDFEFLTQWAKQLKSSATWWQKSHFASEARRLGLD